MGSTSYHCISVCSIHAEIILYIVYRTFSSRNLSCAIGQTVRSQNINCYSIPVFCRPIYIRLLRPDKSSNGRALSLIQSVCHYNYYTYELERIKSTICQTKKDVPMSTKLMILWKTICTFAVWWRQEPIQLRDLSWGSQITSIWRLVTFNPWRLIPIVRIPRFLQKYA